MEKSRKNMKPHRLDSCFMISFEVADGTAALTIEVNVNGEVVNLGTQIFKVTDIDPKPVRKDHPCFKVNKTTGFRICNDIAGHFVAAAESHSTAGTSGRVRSSFGKTYVAIFDAAAPIPCRVATSITRGPPLYP